MTAPAHEHDAVPPGRVVRPAVVSRTPRPRRAAFSEMEAV